MIKNPLVSAAVWYQDYFERDEEVEYEEKTKSSTLSRCDLFVYRGEIKRTPNVKAWYGNIVIEQEWQSRKTFHELYFQCTLCRKICKYALCHSASDCRLCLLLQFSIQDKKSFEPIIYRGYASRLLSAWRKTNRLLVPLRNRPAISHRAQQRRRRHHSFS